MTLYVSSPYHRRMRRLAQRMVESEWPSRESDMVFPIDVKAEQDAYVVYAFLPAVKAEDLNVQVVNETVSISGEIRIERGEDENYLVREMPSGRFSRTITLPERLDSSNAEASLEDGLLTLRIPKVEEVRPKNIKVTRR